ncbi:hypothetical protein DENSPDRAFT_575159 [Dentipellis sp. KUC8613]|nr:hypothetical protein DENSPDRAFT_575159 [Dentipellis sp. KUC8613]
MHFDAIIAHPSLYPVRSISPPMDWDIPLSSSPTSDSGGDIAYELRREYTSPHPYSVTASYSDQSDEASPLETYARDLTLRPIPSGLSFTTAFSCEHRYPLKSRGKECAMVVMRSRSSSPDMPPTYYVGDKITGYVALPLANLQSISRVDVVMQEFAAGQSDAIAESRCKFVPEDIEPASIRSKGHVEWPFEMVPMREAISDFDVASSRSSTSSGRRHSNFSVASRSTKDSQRSDTCLIIVTAHRPGLAQKSVLKQTVLFRSPSDAGSPPVSPQAFNPDPVRRPTRPPPIERTMRNLDPVMIKGLLFQADPVEVECMLGIAVPLTYMLGEAIPLSMTLTTSDRYAVDLLATSQTIDVRLIKTMAFGENAHDVTPKTGSKYKKDECVGIARWVVENTVQLPSPRRRDGVELWQVRLRGSLPTQEDSQASPASFEFQHMSMMYTVRLYPFKAKDFRPNKAANKELLILKVAMTGS